MINRDNWLAVNQYLKYLGTVKQLDKASVDATRTHLRRLLIWADDNPFYKARNIEPTFPVFLQEGGLEKKSLSPHTITRSCQDARVFFEFLRREHPGAFRSITDSWITTLRPSRKFGLQSIVKRRQVFGLEDVKKVIAIEPSTLTEQRDIAAVAFLFCQE